MDVQLAGRMNGIEAAVAIRREFPRLPVVFYSIQDDDAYYPRFPPLRHPDPLRLRPQVELPAAGHARAADPRRGRRAQLHRSRDRGARAGGAPQGREPTRWRCWNPTSRRWPACWPQGLTNEQIAARLGFRDKRTISRVNGQIYAAWGSERDRDGREDRAHPRRVHRRGQRPADPLG